MTPSFISCKGNAHAKPTTCKPMSFNMGSGSPVLRVDDVENTLTVFWGAQDPETSPIGQRGAVAVAVWTFSNSAGQFFRAKVFQTDAEEY
jgi:hypothetical protein